MGYSLKQIVIHQGEACPLRAKPNQPKTLFSHSTQMKQKLLSIQEVSKTLNVPKPTLRYWEKEFQGILVPIRTKGGQRRYTVEQLAIVEQIILLKNEGKSLAEVKETLQGSLESDRGHLNPHPIHILSDRIAKVVRAEILNYLKQIESGSRTTGIVDR